MKKEIKLFGLEDVAARLKAAIFAGEPTLLYGPAGSGKTILAQQLAQEYAAHVKSNKNREIPVVYLQLYPEMTKGTLIGGETLQDGSIVVEAQTIVRLGQKGAVFVIDECTHTTEPVLLAFNSLIEEPRVTVIGDTIYTMDSETRFIFCGNHPDHTGNIELPTSFANRLYIEEINYPEREDCIKIGKHYSDAVDDSIIEFVVEIMQKTRESAKESSLPISPRNLIASMRAVERMNGTGYKAVSGRIPSTSKTLMKALEKADISPEAFKFTLLATMSANIKTHSTVPDKIRAMLW